MRLPTPSPSASDQLLSDSSVYSPRNNIEQASPTSAGHESPSIQEQYDDQIKESISTVSMFCFYVFKLGRGKKKKKKKL